MNLSSKLRAFAVHLAISLGVAAMAAWLVFAVWYPYPYSELSGGRDLFLLVMVVDVVLGPLVTLVIVSPGKTIRHLVADFSVIGLLQVVALSYGLWTVFVARPVHLVFEYQRMAVVHAIDVDTDTLAQAPEALRKLPVYGPTLLSLRKMENPDEQMKSVMLAMAGTAQAAQPGLWQSYELAKDEILKRTKPVEQLKVRFPQHVEAIDREAARLGQPAGGLRFLPMLARDKAWTVLIDPKTALPLGFLPIDSF